MQTKRNSKSLLISTILFVFGAIGIGLMVFFMTLINDIANAEGAEKFTDYIVGHEQELIRVAISIFVLTAILYFYFFFESKQVLYKVSKTIEIFILLYLSIMLSYVLGMFVDPAARPLAFLALMAATLFKRRDAIFINSIFALITVIIDRLSTTGEFSYLTGVSMIDAYSCLLCTFCSGIVAIFLFNNVKTRTENVLVAIILLIPVEFINCILKLPTSDWAMETFLNLLMYGAMDCVFSVMLYMFILPIFELIFAELTVFRLRELTSDNAKLIKRLKENAPGTYNHSVVVSQLVEACAKAIGEDAELARAAAYYHDVGKLKSPEMFAENQTDYNFHNELTPELSVDIIRSHAKDGAMLIRKNRLPEFFADVAVQHHGTLPIKYFYVKALKMSDGELNVENYSYAGPVPESKIAALIMIADASEAATRSLSDRSPANVEALVRSLIEERLDLNQFDDCNITMHELSVIRSTIVNQLTGVYHSRVAYPKITISNRK